MISKGDVRGVCAMVPTPAIEGGEHWSVEHSVDLEEAARMTAELVRAGIGSIAAAGTTGECAALLWEEKLEFIDTIVQVNQHRVPVFAGATALGTKEVVRQMRGLRDVGAEGAFIGLPLWQTPTIENSVRFFADLSEAVPDMGIMVYANPMFFKSTFPTAFWEGIGRRAPTVITNKIGAAPVLESLQANVRVSGHQVVHQSPEGGVTGAYRLVGDHIQGFWSTSCCQGPEPSLALWEALQRGDLARAEEIAADLRSLPSFIPPDEREMFNRYNAQAEKARFRASGYIKAGMSRAPYYYEELPESWKRSTEAHGRAWAELRKKYAKAAV